MAAFTKEEQAIHDILVDYDKVRKAEGYAIAYRRWASYTNIFDGIVGNKKVFGKHVETLYLNPNGKSLLVKCDQDGGISAFEAVG